MTCKKLFLVLKNKSINEGIMGLEQFSVIALPKFRISQQRQFRILSSLRIALNQKKSGPKRYASNYS